jgi:hypothetical protein
MKTIKTTLIATSCALLFAVIGVGCSTPMAKKLNRLEIGMNQAQVKKILGADYVVKASKLDADGAALQLWDFHDEDKAETYSLYFKDGILAQWGTPAKMAFAELNLPKK